MNERTYVTVCVEDLVEAINTLTKEYGCETPLGELAALCTLLHLEIGSLNLGRNPYGKVVALYRRMIAGGARESRVYIQLKTLPETPHHQPPGAVVGAVEGPVMSCMHTLLLPDPVYPAGLKETLLATGVDEYVIDELWSTSPTFKVRMRNKFQVFARLCRKGEVHSPTGFLIDAVRNNRLLDIRYRKDWKREQQALKEQRRVQVPDLDPQTVDHERTARFLSRLSSPPVFTSA